MTVTPARYESRARAAPHLHRGIDDQDRSGGTRHPALHRGADLGGREPLAVGGVEREPDHLVQTRALGQRAARTGTRRPRPALQLHVPRRLEVLVGRERCCDGPSEGASARTLGRRCPWARRPSRIFISSWGDDLVSGPGRRRGRLRTMSIFDRWAGIIAWSTRVKFNAGRHPILGRVAFYSLVVLGLVPLAFSYVMTRPFRSPTGPPRAGFVEGHVVSDGLRLRIWTRPGSPARPGVVIVHGVGDSPRASSSGMSSRPAPHVLLLAHAARRQRRRLITLGARDVRTSGRNGPPAQGGGAVRLWLVGIRWRGGGLRAARTARRAAVIVEAHYNLRETTAPTLAFL